MVNALFRVIMAVFVRLYQLSGGRIGGRMAGLRVLRLTTVGRKTGKQRSTLLGYFEADGGYVITASNGGQETHPGWYHNLVGHPDVTIQVGARSMGVRATVAAPDERDQLWKRLVEQAPGYGPYAQKTSRVIPMVILRPVAA